MLKNLWEVLNLLTLKLVFIFKKSMLSTMNFWYVCQLLILLFVVILKLIHAFSLSSDKNLLLRFLLSKLITSYQYLKVQAWAYEACDCMCTPLHMPKTEMYKKSTPYFIKKASRCAADPTSKTITFFIFCFL